MNVVGLTYAQQNTWENIVDYVNGDIEPQQFFVREAPGEVGKLLIVPKIGYGNRILTLRGLARAGLIEMPSDVSRGFFITQLGADVISGKAGIGMAQPPPKVKFQRRNPVTRKYEDVSDEDIKPGQHVMKLYWVEEFGKYVTIPGDCLFVMGDDLRLRCIDDEE